MVVGLAIERFPALRAGISLQPPDQIHLAWTGDPSTTMTVVWRTRYPGNSSVVQYRALGETCWRIAKGALRPSSTTGALHEVTLASLKPLTRYEYRVQGDGSTWSDAFVTRTAPPHGPADFDAIYFADMGVVGREDGLATGAQQVIEEIAVLNPLLILGGGDYAYLNTDGRFRVPDDGIDAWFNQMQPVLARSPIMPTYGNHEIFLGEGYSKWSARFPTPDGFDNRRNYSFDLGEVHFVSILTPKDDYSGLENGQVRWIEQDIRRARQAGRRWIIPFMHGAPFADGSNHPSNLEIRAQLGPLFERHGVKLVLCSHDQAYERTYPLVDVPARNTPTSTSLDRYTMEDGITWVKTSPAGKLSNINRSFSQFATEPAPAWTACRENTMHHFSRLMVSASGSIRLETYGVVGDGSPPVIVDSFEYVDTPSRDPERV